MNLLSKISVHYSILVSYNYSVIYIVDLDIKYIGDDIIESYKSVAQYLLSIQYIEWYFLINF